MLMEKPCKWVGRVDPEEVGRLSEVRVLDAVTRPGVDVECRDDWPMWEGSWHTWWVWPGVDKEVRYAWILCGGRVMGGVARWRAVLS